MVLPSGRSSNRFRSQASKIRTSMSRTNSIELRPHSMRGISSFSSSPHSVRSSSVTTTSASDPDDELDYLADRPRSDGSENSTPWLCCASRGGRKEKRGSEPDDVPITPSTPPQHRRFSWEAHDDDESRSSPDSDSSGSTLGSEHQRDQSTVSPIFACLPCLLYFDRVSRMVSCGFDALMRPSASGTALRITGSP